MAVDRAGASGREAPANGLPILVSSNHGAPAASYRDTSACFLESSPSDVAPSRPERPRYAAIAARQLADPIVALLVVAVVVAAALGEGGEAAAIGLIVVLNAALGFWQESGAERAVLALRDRFHPTAAVIRDGHELEVDAEDVVPGDLLVLREGDGVAADARVVDAHGMEVDESMLTGEAMPVGKAADPVPPEAALGDRTAVVHAGTAVTRGRATALVVTTGDATETGLIMDIGQWTIDEGCRQLRRWRDQGSSLRTMWVNLSARQLQRPAGQRAV